MNELKRNRSRNVLAMLTVIAGFSAAFAAGYAFSQSTTPAPVRDSAQMRDAGSSAARVAPPVVETPATRDAAAMQNAFAEVAKAAEPAVVTITTRRRLPQANQGRRGPGPNPGPFGGPFGQPFEGPDPFEEFFRRFREFGPGPGVAPRASVPEDFHRMQGPGGGIGSGFIYQADGLILTNAHVVRDADEVTVKLSDDREFKNAKVLGVDTRTDVAVIKINAKNLTTVQTGDSTAVRVGDWAIALGNPFGLQNTLTVGVISAKAREVPLTEAGPGDYLQTDASINPGNSGGPLLDIYGRVVGVNNAIFSRSGGNIGIGFAIPINTAREIADILVKEGKVTRAYLGARISNMEDRAAAFGLDPKATGVLIEAVEPNSPASRAGLQPGDVVTQFNGQAVTRSIELQRLVGRSAVGSTAKLQVLRGGKTVTLTVRLEELKGADSAPAVRPGAEGEPKATSTALGLRLAPLTPELARRYGIEGVKTTQGAIVVGAENGSPAAAAGLRAGDVIERVGQTAISSPQEVQAAVKRVLDGQTGDDKGVALYVNRRGERRFVIVNVGP